MLQRITLLAAGDDDCGGPVDTDGLLDGVLL